MDHRFLIGLPAEAVPESPSESNTLQVIARRLPESVT
jgi:hypothetical protein